MTTIDMPTPVATNPDSVWPYVRALRRRARMILAIPIALALVVLAVAWQRPRYFAARAAFIASEPQSMSGSLGALSSVASQLGIPGLSAVANSSASLSAQFYGSLLTSDAMLHEIVTSRYDAGARETYSGEPFRGTLVEYLGAEAKTTPDRERDAMKRFARKVLIVDVDRPTGVVHLTVRTKNRQLSALVARRLLDLVNEFNLRRRQTQAGAEREFDARRARSSLDSLRATEAALADFRASNIDFSRSPRLEAREGELQRRVSLAQQIYTTVAQRYELASIEAVRNTPVITVLDAPEGLVEAQPRHTGAIVIGALGVGFVIACGIALGMERPRGALR
jgi:uncharacterized protein involved in exopolysaccharide biosynthesis